MDTSGEMSGDTPETGDAGLTVAEEQAVATAIGRWWWVWIVLGALLHGITDIIKAFQIKRLGSLPHAHMSPKYV